MNELYVCSYASLETAKVVHVEHDGGDIMVALIGGRLLAYDGTCLHRGGPLWKGRWRGARLQCPWHGCEWDLESGVCVQAPALRLASYPTRCENGEVYVVFREDV